LRDEEVAALAGDLQAIVSHRSQMCTSCDEGYVVAGCSETASKVTANATRTQHNNLHFGSPTS
jgi:hypothetical protein